MKSALRVLTEAAFIGAVLALIMAACMRALPGTSIEYVAFACGAAFHVGCQITGLNDWYARTHFAP
jgi:hypothetical protein